MNEDGSRGSGMTSEASRMLEAALEQMDGIIQGARYDLPQFDNFSIQVNKPSNRGVYFRNKSFPLPYPVPFPQNYLSRILPPYWNFEGK